jgi:DNA-binding response OmpR family regulator
LQRALSHYPVAAKELKTFLSPRSAHGDSLAWLVVEDDPLIALDLKATLERAGAVVLGPAGRLNDAMLLAEKSLPVAAMLDVRLEVGTSLPLAKWLAERDVPFVFQSSDPALIDAAYSAAPVLRKPFRPEQLIAALAALLAKER